MEILIFWLSLAFVVAIAASSRGRSGAGWFIISAIFSPLIGLILVLVLPNLRHERMIAELEVGRRQHTKTSGWGTKTTSVKIDRSELFEPDRVYAGIPYRVAHDGSIEAVMQGMTVKFRDIDKFMVAVGGAT